MISNMKWNQESYNKQNENHENYDENDFGVENYKENGLDKNYDNEWQMNIKWQKYDFVELPLEYNKSVNRH